jgi:hypothetical protein
MGLEFKGHWRCVFIFIPSNLRFVLASFGKNKSNAWEQKSLRHQIC